MKGTFRSILASPAGDSDDGVYFTEPSVGEMPFVTLPGQTSPQKTIENPKKWGSEGL